MVVTHDPLRCTVDCIHRMGYAGRGSGMRPTISLLSDAAEAPPRPIQMLNDYRKRPKGVSRFDQSHSQAPRSAL